MGVITIYVSMAQLHFENRNMALHLKKVADPWVRVWFKDMVKGLGFGLGIVFPRPLSEQRHIVTTQTKRTL